MDEKVVGEHSGEAGEPTLVDKLWASAVKGSSTEAEK